MSTMRLSMPSFWMPFGKPNHSSLSTWPPSNDTLSADHTNRCKALIRPAHISFGRSSTGKIFQLNNPQRVRRRTGTRAQGIVEQQSAGAHRFLKMRVTE
jgi:hypothetical protein